jgi:hypothetical protein
MPADRDWIVTAFPPHCANPALTARVPGVIVALQQLPQRSNIYRSGP